ncbi:hypothetical protein AVEN_47821-1 [Araneus ventricosus]|uniref:Uncharacterized protein n=1 Tax=Araneus ventricosus TaxID=182803 RepID=A0A4Y2VZM3_ARAVE|nr:hypothetical protein AVEN_47821-1 [Araneus ventricosus]
MEGKPLSKACVLTSARLQSIETTMDGLPWRHTPKIFRSLWNFPCWQQVSKKTSSPPDPSKLYSPETERGLRYGRWLHLAFLWNPTSIHHLLGISCRLAETFVKIYSLECTW